MAEEDRTRRSAVIESPGDGVVRSDVVGWSVTLALIAASLFLPIAWMMRPPTPLPLRDASGFHPVISQLIEVHENALVRSQHRWVLVAVAASLIIHFVRPRQLGGFAVPFLSLGSVAVAILAGTPVPSMILWGAVTALVITAVNHPRLTRWSWLFWGPALWWISTDVLAPIGRTTVQVDDPDFLSLLEEHVAIAMDDGLVARSPSGGLYGGLGHLFAAAQFVISRSLGMQVGSVELAQHLQVSFILLLILALGVLARQHLPILLLAAAAIVPVDSLGTRGGGMLFVNQSGARYLGLMIVIAALVVASRSRVRSGPLIFIPLAISIALNVEVGLVSTVGTATYVAFSAAPGSGLFRRTRDVATAAAGATSIAGLAILAVPGLGPVWLRNVRTIFEFSGGFGGFIGPVTPLTAVMFPLLGLFLMLGITNRLSDEHPSSLLAALAVMGLALTTKFANRMLEWEAWPIALLLVLCIGVVMAWPRTVGPSRARTPVSAVIAASAILLAAGPGIQWRASPTWVPREGVTCGEEEVRVDQYCLPADLAGELNRALAALDAAVADRASTVVLGTTPALLVRRGFNLAAPRASAAGEVVRASDPAALGAEIEAAGIQRIVVLRPGGLLSLHREGWIDLQDEIRVASGGDLLVWQDAFWDHYVIDR